MSQNTEKTTYGSHNEHGGEAKDRLPQATSGGAATEPTPANTEDGKSGIKVTPTHDPSNQPEFAYRKPGQETLGEKAAKLLSGN